MSKRTPDPEAAARKRGRADGFAGRERAEPDTPTRGLTPNLETTMPTDADAKPVHHLSHAERDWLAGINRLLTEMTRSHHPCCPCELCEARVLTDTQDEAAYHVPFEPADCG